MTFEEIDAAKEDSVLYYKLLVKTRMEYVGRVLNKDTAFEYKSLSERLEQKAKENFVNIINGLHNEETARSGSRSIQSLARKNCITWLFHQTGPFIHPVL